MGGYCALALARRAPERVRALLLVGSRPDADSPERRAGRADTIELIRREGPDGLWRSMLPKLFADEATRRCGLDASRTPTTSSARSRRSATARTRRTRARLSAARCSSSSASTSPFVTPGELAEFDVREVAGAGHLVNIERPDEFNAILQEFLARV